MKLEFFEPAEAASVLKCSEAWLRDGAAKGEFPHSVWGKGKIVFTSVHLKEIAQLREVRSTSPSPSSVRLIGTGPRHARNTPSLARTAANRARRRRTSQRRPPRLEGPEASGGRTPAPSSGWMRAPGAWTQ